LFKTQRVYDEHRQITKIISSSQMLRHLSTVILLAFHSTWFLGIFFMMLRLAFNVCTLPYVREATPPRVPKLSSRSSTGKSVSRQTRASDAASRVVNHRQTEVIPKIPA
jgi:hypothetical protein